MHYYKFNIKDWSRDTAHLSVEEEGVYRRLIDLYYESEMPIPKETQMVIRRLRLAGHEESVGIILEEFFTLTDEGYRHLRCDDEIGKYHAKAVANRKNGGAGGRPKKPTENPVGFQEEPSRNLNHKPLTTNQEPETNNQQSAENPTADKRRNWVRELVSLGVAENHAKDWLEVRKAKKAKMTDTALEGVQREAEIAGITLGEAVKIAAERSWQGFKASWLKSDQVKNPGITKHTGFSDRDYHEGLIEREDGSYGF